MRNRLTIFFSGVAVAVAVYACNSDGITAPEVDTSADVQYLRQDQESALLHHFDVSSLVDGSPPGALGCYSSIPGDGQAGLKARDLLGLLPDGSNLHFRVVETSDPPQKRVRMSRENPVTQRSVRATISQNAIRVRVDGVAAAVPLNGALHQRLESQVRWLERTNCFTIVRDTFVR